MTQEEKQLLLKDLCARLPYGVIMQYEHFLPMKIRQLNETCINDKYVIETCKPYLRPMASMTEGEKEIVNNLIYNKESIWTSPIPVWVINESDIEEYIDFCNSHYLDHRNLIEKGLALEAPEEMYKTDRYD